MTTVRDAQNDDREALAEMLARAFASDPVTVWLLPDAAKRPAFATEGFRMGFDEDAGGMRLTTMERDAASFWRFSSERERARTSQTDSPAMEPSATDSEYERRVAILMAAMDAHKPTGDFWYLHIVGCDPTKQGTGRGVMVVRAGLDRIGNASVYLETANEKNVGFYEKMGFRVTEEWNVLEGGPRLWSMLRSPG